MTDRIVVILSPYFPPSSVAAVHRARHLAKHLPGAGWQAIVLSVDEACHRQRPDTDLVRLVPPGVEILKVGAIPASLSRFLGIGEIGLRAWYPLRRALFLLLATRRVDAVLITGSPYYPMLLAPEIRHDFEVPVILDFQDPWVSAWGASQPTLSKAGLTHRLAVLLEPRALRAADFVTSVSDIQNDEMAARYPWLDRSHMAALPIGADPDDFIALRTASHVDGVVDLDPSAVNFSYVGTYLPRAEPLMRTFLRAFARLRTELPMLASRIRLNFIGTSNQAIPTSIYPVRSLAEAEGVGDAVQEIPSRVPYLSALDALTRSHGVLLIGSDEPHYTASKIYPALMCGRPFLSLFHRASSAHASLSACGGGCALDFEELGQLPNLERPIAEALRMIALNPQSFGTPNPAACAPYQARAIAFRFAEILDCLADGRIT